jgi:KaiC/GvpD/RAD55 family RecA-like ATPase
MDTSVGDIFILVGYLNVAMEKILSGIPGLDEILNGGLPRGTTVLVAGGSGTGKSIFCAQFLYNGIVQYGENGVLVTLEERPQDLKAEMLEFGWDLEKLEKGGKLTIIDAASIKIPVKIRGGYIKSGGFDVDKLMTLISAAIKKNDARRVVVDTIPALELGLESETEVRKSLFELTSLLLETGCTTMMTTESLENKISRYGVEEFIFRGVILLDIVMSQENVVRTITVRKMRQCNHSLETHPFVIGDDGIVIYSREKVFI